MKNYLGWTIIFCLLFLFFVSPLFAQLTVKEIEYPLNYQSWPNVLRKEKVIGQNIISFFLCAKQIKGTEKIEWFSAVKINGEIIIANHEYVAQKRHFDHNITFLNKGSGWAVIFWAVEGGYFKFDSRNFEDPSSGNSLKAGEKEARERINLLFENSAKLDEGMRLGDEKLAQKLQNVGIGKTEYEKTLADFWGPETQKFMENLAESKKRN